MDSLWQRVQDKVDSDIITEVNEMKQYLDDEEYDSDAILYDLEDIQDLTNATNSNILQKIPNMNIAETMYDYTKSRLSMLFLCIPLILMQLVVVFNANQLI